MPGENTLPIKRLTLYKHGVGYVQRQGPVTGEEIQLVFRADEVNDALKSLLVLDQAGGQILGIHYQTPADQEARLAECPISLSGDHSLLDLLRGLRGWAVRLALGDETARQEIQGRLVGVEVEDDHPIKRALVTVLEEGSGAVRVLALGTIREVYLLEDRAGQDLRYFLDVSRTEEAHRTVTLRLSPGEHTLAVSYLVPSPTWRVSYRLVAESDAGPHPQPLSQGARGDTGPHPQPLSQGARGDAGPHPQPLSQGARGDADPHPQPLSQGARGDADPHPQPLSQRERGADVPTPKTGKLLLQGWGLFDNRLEEDLEDVGVTLVAGQPISFIYDLAASRIPDRPVVEDQARVAAAPVEFERPQAGRRMAKANGADMAPAGMAYGAAMAMAPAPMMMAEMAPPVPPPTIDQMAQQAVGATGGDLGELFQYQVVAPVTVKRGASALVPILNAQMAYRRELLFNQQKLAEHPVAALRFHNETGLVLERGPVTVMEDGDYHGEAIVAFSKEGNELYIPFAVELGIKITQASTTGTETVGIQIDQALLWRKQAVTTSTTYTLDNSLGTAELVTIEHPIWSNYELVETREPDAKTSDFYRWVVPCAAGAVTTLVVQQRRYDWQQQQLLDQAYESLQDFLKSRWLDQPTLDRIRSLLDEKSTIAKNNRKIINWQLESNQIYGREEQLRKNMAALATTGDEATLRQQVFLKLKESEDRLAVIDQRTAALTNENTQRQATIDAELKKLKVEDTSARR